MTSVLITAYKEQDTIGKCIKCIADADYSGIPEDFEILLACPDEETKNVAIKVIKELKIENKFKHIQDPKEGKPNALNMLMDEAKGDIWILTDGDVWFGERAVEHLLYEFTQRDNPLLVTGRPVSADSKNTMMGYFGNLLADAAHHKRRFVFSEGKHGKSSVFLSKEPFFPVSGYIYAMTKTNERFPKDCLADDGYISYALYNKGVQLGYAEEAIAYVKYPKHLSDYFKQKRRSAGGYPQLWKYGIVKKDTVTRSAKKEIQYFWFPILYAKNPLQLFWSLMLYPIRFYQWAIIYWDQKIMKKDLMGKGGWERIETTK
jgi:cellulose synthase/poly-beta-1,6-N-acetylglucosamine synthase-like glycosyltransferase